MRMFDPTGFESEPSSESSEGNAGNAFTCKCWFSVPSLQSILTGVHDAVLGIGASGQWEVNPNASPADVSAAIQSLRSPYASPNPQLTLGLLGVARDILSGPAGIGSSFGDIFNQLTGRPNDVVKTSAAVALIFGELQTQFPDVYGKLSPNFTVGPGLGNGLTVGNWVNINSIRYGKNLDPSDLYQLAVTVAHESLHTAQSFKEQVFIQPKRLTDENYDPNAPHWIIEDRAHEYAGKILPTLRDKLFPQTRQEK